MLSYFYKVSFLFCSFMLLIFASFNTGCVWAPDILDQFGFHMNQVPYSLKGMRKSYVVCESQDCPPHIGGLVFRRGTKSMSSCSTQLTSANRIFINRHCIPDHLQKAGASCADHMRAVFPEIPGYPQESHECDKIVDLTPHPLNKEEKANAELPDWAIVQLKTSSKRPPAQTSLAGIKDQVDLTLYPTFWKYQAADAVPHYKGRIKKVTCKTSMTHFLLNTYFHEDSKIFGAGECDRNIVGGNSGSGVYDSQGKLTGIGSFALVSGVINKIEGKSFYVDNNVIGGTRLGCISYFAGEVKNPFCKWSSKVEFKAFGMTMVRSNALKRNKEFYEKVMREATLRVVNTPYLKWGQGTTEPNFSAEIITQRRYYRADKFLPDEVTDYYRNTLNEVTLPFIPLCIKENAPTEFKIELPVIQVDPAKTVLNKKGEYVFTPRLDHAEFVFSRRLRFRKSKETGKIRLKYSDGYSVSLTDSPEKVEETFDKYKTEIKNLRYQCYKEGRSKDKDVANRRPTCKTLNSKKQEFARWISRENLSHTILANENLRFQVGYFHVKLPICTENEANM